DDQYAILRHPISEINRTHKGGIEYHHVLRLLDMAVYGDRLVANAVISDYRSPHPFRPALGESLEVLACRRSRLPEQQGSGFGSLAAAAMPTYLQVLSHLETSFKLIMCLLMIQSAQIGNFFFGPNQSLLTRLGHQYFVHDLRDPHHLVRAQAFRDRQSVV